MTIGSGLFLIAAGAILKWAITAHVSGIIGLCIGLYLVFRVRWSPRPGPGPTGPP